MASSRASCRHDCRSDLRCEQRSLLCIAGRNILAAPAPAAPVSPSLANPGHLRPPGEQDLPLAHDAAIQEVPSAGVAEPLLCEEISAAWDTGKITRCKRGQGSVAWSSGHRKQVSGRVPLPHWTGTDSSFLTIRGHSDAAIVPAEERGALLLRPRAIRPRVRPAASRATLELLASPRKCSSSCRKEHEQARIVQPQQYDKCNTDSTLTPRPWTRAEDGGTDHFVQTSKRSCTHCAHSYYPPLGSMWATIDYINEMNGRASCSTVEPHLYYKLILHVILRLMFGSRFQNFSSSIVIRLRGRATTTFAIPIVHSIHARRRA